MHLKKVLDFDWFCMWMIAEYYFIVAVYSITAPQELYTRITIIA